jgi:hypothetical protein
MCSDLAIRSGTAAKIAPKHYNKQARTLTFCTKKGREMCLPVTDELDAMLRPLAGLDAETPFVCLLHPQGHVHSRHLRDAMVRLRKSGQSHFKTSPEGCRGSRHPSLHV